MRDDDSILTRERGEERYALKPTALPSWSWTGVAVLTLAGIGAGWLIVEGITGIVSVILNMTGVPD